MEEDYPQKVEMDHAKMQNHDLQKQLTDAQATMEKYLRDYEALCLRTQKVTTDLENQVTENKKLQAEHASIDKEIKLKLAEIGRLKTENQLLERKVDMEHRAGLQFKQMAADAKNPLLEAQAEIANLKAELLAAKKIETVLEKKAETIERERESKLKMYLRAEAKVKEQSDLKIEQERLAVDLGNEIKEYVEEGRQLRKVHYN